MQQEDELCQPVGTGRGEEADLQEISVQEQKCRQWVEKQDQGLFKNTREEYEGKTEEAPEGGGEAEEGRGPAAEEEQGLAKELEETSICYQAEWKRAAVRAMKSFEDSHEGKRAAD